MELYTPPHDIDFWQNETVNKYLEEEFKKSKKQKSLSLNELKKELLKWLKKNSSLAEKKSTKN